MSKIRPPKGKKGGVELPYRPYPHPIEALRDILKAEVYYANLYAGGGMDYKSYRGHQHGMALMARTLATVTTLEHRHGNINETAKKPVTVVRERRIERPLAGTPPKRPTDGAGGPLIPPKPHAAPNGGHSATVAPRPPKVLH
jgi:hypothetical protein